MAESTMSIGKPLRPILSAACAIGLTLVFWVLLVTLLDGLFARHDKLIWAGSLWIAATSCTMFVAYSRFAVRPVLACTIGFGIFALVYFACEGPIFGDVSQGGDPTITSFVFWNLVFLPVGALAASDAGATLGARRRRHVVCRQRTCE